MSEKKSKQEYEADVDKFIDVYVQYPGAQEPVESSVKLMASQNQSWSVEQEKERLLGNEFNASSYSMIVKPFCLAKKGQFNLELKGPTADETVMIDSDDMQEYCEKLTGGFIFFRFIAQPE